MVIPTIRNLDFYGVSVSAGSMLPLTSTEGSWKDMEAADPICGMGKYAQGIGAVLWPVLCH